MDAEETKMLNSLTWRPLDGDILLFALAVVAPYQTMHSFKYKVKLTPGTGKRGKAAKSAIALFQVALLFNFLYKTQKNLQIPGNMSKKIKPQLCNCFENEIVQDIK